MGRDWGSHTCAALLNPSMILTDKILGGGYTDSIEKRGDL